MYDLIIIGAGPAGISASLYAKRANLKVLVLYHGKADLESASQIDNYYGFKDGISGKELYENGIEQAKRIGVDVREEEVINIEPGLNDIYLISTTENKYETKAVILSTGNKKIKPNISGINEFDGRGISYCAICDGFFYRNKNVVVIGNGNYALNEARELAHVAGNVKILTNGLDGVEQNEFEVITKKIKCITGEAKVENIEFEDGEILKLDGIFVALGEAGGTDFAKKIGIIMNGDNIKVNENMETNIKGIFAAGNLTGGLLQISKAVCDGAKAGLQAINYIRNK